MVCERLYENFLLTVVLEISIKLLPKIVLLHDSFCGLIRPSPRRAEISISGAFLDFCYLICHRINRSIFDLTTEKILLLPVVIHLFFYLNFESNHVWILTLCYC